LKGEAMEDGSNVWAIIDSSQVVNTVVWDGESSWSPPDGTSLVCLADYPHVGIGWDYADGQFVDNRPTDELAE